MERRQAQYAQFLVEDVQVPIDTHISPQYNAYEGQHPLDHEAHREEEYNPMFEDRRGRGGYTSLMLPIKRRSFGITEVLGYLGADWHMLANAHGHTAYAMLKVAALTEQYVPGPNNTGPVGVLTEVKRGLRSLLRVCKTASYKGDYAWVTDLNHLIMVSTYPKSPQPAPPPQVGVTTRRGYHQVPPKWWVPPTWPQTPLTCPQHAPAATGCN